MKSEQSVYYNPKKKVCYRLLDFLGYPGYRVGTDGSVWTKWIGTQFGGRVGYVVGLSDKWIKVISHADDEGYLRVNLRYEGGRSKGWGVGPLVLAAFCGPRPRGMQCCHFPDLNPSNNDLSNLMWGTPKTNQSHRLVHGTDNRGERAGMAKLTRKEAEDIFGLYRTGRFTFKELGERFKVHSDTVRNIVKGKGWKNLGLEWNGFDSGNEFQTRSRGEKHPKAKLTAVEIDEIRRLYSTGKYTCSQLAPMFDSCSATISNVISGRGRFCV